MNNETFTPHEDRAPSASELARAALDLNNQNKPEQYNEGEGRSEFDGNQPDVYSLLELLEAQKDTRRMLAKLWLKNSGAKTVEERKEAIKNRPNWLEIDEGDSILDSPTESYLTDTLKKQKVQIDLLMKDEHIKEQYEQLGTEKLEVFRRVAAYRYLDRTQMVLEQELLQERLRQVQLKETNNRAMSMRMQHVIEEIRHIQESKLLLINSEECIKELERRATLDDARALESGILMTDKMLDIERRSLPTLVKGRPVLLVGETGGAKTALAEHMARQILELYNKPDGYEPEFISGYAEVNAYQLMGKTELRTGGASRPLPESLKLTTSEEELLQNELADLNSPEYRALMDKIGFQKIVITGIQSTETVFVPGAMTRAIKDGKPIILDEINAMPPEFLKRLNKILQLKPGDTLTLQEDGDEKIRVAEGFCVIATANEKSQRYKGVDDLSVEFKNRFAGNVERINYPDGDVELGSLPPELTRLAIASMTNSSGEITFYEGEGSTITSQQFKDFIIICHISQQMFSKPAASQKFINYVDSDRVAESGKTALEKEVLAPRTMIAILNKVRDSNGTVTLTETLRSFVEGVKNLQDREVLRKLVSSRESLAY